jgi:hypothetical protein
MSFPLSRGIRIRAARDLQVHFDNDLFRHLPFDLTPLGSVAERQRIEAKIINPAWNAAAALCQRRLRLGAEEGRAVIARDAQAVRDILWHFPSFKRRKPAETRYALAQLSQLTAGQLAGQ